MTTVRIPTPLRPYAAGQRELNVDGETVAAALHELAHRYPAMGAHLFDDEGRLRPYVNLFLNDEDVRQLQGAETPLSPSDRLMIVPSIAGGSQPDPGLRPVDHAALRVNQAMIITLLGLAFLANAAWLSALVGLALLLGTAVGKPAFLPVYRLLRTIPGFRPDVVPDNPGPHRFAQGFGALVLLLALGAFVIGTPFLGWSLTLLVAALAGLNLFAGFCLGCALYYWLSRLGIPGFRASAPAGVLPGRQPGGKA